MINITQGTLTHFLHLSKEQEENFFKTLELPEISFKGDTAHRYAAKNLQNLELGAVSEEGVLMAYTTHDGLMRATQFHPEHVYNSRQPEDAPQIAWLDNAIKNMLMHHADKLDNGHRVKDYFKSVNDKLIDWFTEHLFDPVEIIG